MYAFAMLLYLSAIFQTSVLACDHVILCVTSSSQAILVDSSPPTTGSVDVITTPQSRNEHTINIRYRLLQYIYSLGL